jgi:hypothetical protein
MFERALDIRESLIETLKALKAVADYDSDLDLTSNNDWELMDESESNCQANTQI